MTPLHRFPLLLALLATLAVGGFGRPALADLRNNPTEQAWITNGPVTAITCTPQTTYIGGSFTHVGPYTGAGVPVDLQTGRTFSSFSQVQGIVRACIADGEQGWYIGGDFTRVGSLTRTGLAHILPSGQVDPAWTIDTNSDVMALALHDGVLYVSGWFSTIGGQSRTRLASVDLASGQVTGWNPQAGYHASTFAFSDSTLYVGGTFTTMGGRERGHGAAFDLATGQLLDWDPQADQEIDSMTIDDGVLYVGGWFDTIGGQTRASLAALDLTTAQATAWDAHLTNDMILAVYQIIVHDQTVYACGCFFVAGGQSRRSVVAVDAQTGAPTAWAPTLSTDDSFFIFDMELVESTLYVGGEFKTLGGKPRSYLAAIDAVSGQILDWSPTTDEAILTLAASGSALYVGGGMRSLGGCDRYGIAALDATTGQCTDWAPSIFKDISYIYYNTAIVQAILVTDSTVYVGGDFENIDGQERDGLGSIDRNTGQVSDWAPNPGAVKALALEGSTLYVGGDFRSLAGQSRDYLGSYNLQTGELTDWNPSPSYLCNALLVSDSRLYVAGSFSSIANQTRYGLAAFDCASGTLSSWDAQLQSASAQLPVVYCMAESDSTLYVGGYFNKAGGADTQYLAALDLTTAQSTDWPGQFTATGPCSALAMDASNIYAVGTFSGADGQERSGLAALGLVSGQLTDWAPTLEYTAGGQYVWPAMATGAGRLYFGYRFTSINEQPRWFLAQFDPQSDLAPNRWNAYQ